jgi:uncharacterized membrane protein YeaQ/YmgE (transglycosylase-associated protein family)
MGFIWAIIVGALVGFVAKLFMPGNDHGGFIMTVILGILGSIVGGFLFGWMGLGGGGFLGFIGAVLGAMILLWFYRLFLGERVEA